MASYHSGSVRRRQAADDLMTKKMAQAEIVFTTLSSTGRRPFLSGRPFDLVLVDEAAQLSLIHI